jgi:hypothetical protein
MKDSEHLVHKTFNGIESDLALERKMSPSLDRRSAVCGQIDLSHSGERRNTRLLRELVCLAFGGGCFPKAQIWPACCSFPSGLRSWPAS